MISYEPLWKTLKSKNISQYKLINTYNIGNGQIQRFRENKHVSTHTLEYICKVLDCKIEDIVEYIPDQEDEI